MSSTSRTSRPVRSPSDAGLRTVGTVLLAALMPSLVVRVTSTVRTSRIASRWASHAAGIMPPRTIPTTTCGIPAPDHAGEVSEELAGEAFLDLEPTSETLRDPPELGQAQHLTVRYISGGDLQAHGQHVVLTQRPDVHAAHNDQLAAQLGFGE